MTGVMGWCCCQHLYLAALLEAVRDRTKSVDLQQINGVLMQPHWRLRPDPD